MEKHTFKQVIKVHEVNGKYTVMLKVHLRAGELTQPMMRVVRLEMLHGGVIPRH